MALSSGTRIGPYEIVAPLGSKELYTARDTRLDRTVAIRVLPAEWTASPELKQRFEREAQRIASLNHPNICKVHDVGRLRAEGASASATASADKSASQASEVSYLVMEHLTGETLAARLGRGPVALDEALRIGIAVAGALDEAHRQGVVHRDLKPANILLTATGPKLIDFKMASLGPDTRSPGSLDLGKSPGSEDPGLHKITPITPITQIGTTLGALQYMAPEQLDGHEADARTDIFAFGVVLHEMITGRRAFEGKSQVLLISAIATSDPPALSRVQPAVPPALDHVVKTCLAKDPDDRWQSARDLVAELRWIADGGGAIDATAPPSARPPTRTRAMRVALIAAGVLIAALVVPAVLFVRGAPPPPRMEIRISTNPLAYTGFSGNQSFFAISPDGRRLVVAAREGSAGTAAPYSLYVGTVDFLHPIHLAGTDDAFQPFWSPNGKEIAFLTKGKLMKIEATGGPARPICEAPELRGGTWNPDGTILFGSRTGIFSVPAEGGKPTNITTPESTELGHFWPRFLPDGRHFLYLAWSGDAAARVLMAGSLDSKDKKKVMSVESNAVFTSGYLLFRSESSLYAQRFDPAGLALSGAQARLADGVPHNTTNGRGPFDVSDNGVVVFYRDLTDSTAMPSTDAAPEREWQLASVSRAGRESERIGKPGGYRGGEVSRDGTRIAVHRHDPKGGDVWVLEPGGTETRITFDATQDNSNPVWSQDGLRITYASFRKGKWGLYQAASDGSGKEELLLESELPKAPLQWSPDRQFLLFWVEDPKTSDDLWVWPAADKKARPLIATDASERHGQISPDGKWIAYSSTLTSRREIYVQPFPAGSGRYQVSPDIPSPEAGTAVGGGWPRWSQTTNELFYLSVGDTLVRPRSLFSVAWKANGSTFTHEPPKPLIGIYALQTPHSGGDYQTYAVFPDAKRFLVYQDTAVVNVQTASDTPDPLAGLTVILNWLQGIKK